MKEMKKKKQKKIRNDSNYDPSQKKKEEGLKTKDKRKQRNA